MAPNYATDPPHWCGRRVSITIAQEQEQDERYEMHCSECNRVLGDWYYRPRERQRTPAGSYYQRNPTP